MQDINNLLNSGEVPGMFGPDDKERLATSMRERVEAGGQVASKVRGRSIHCIAMRQAGSQQC